jgi:hypothetical protein
MPDIFNKTPRNVAGAFSVDKAQMQFTAPGFTGSAGLLVQNVQITYSQQVSFVYDLAKSDDVYYIAGRAQGQMAIGKLVGPSGIVKAFYEAYGDVCQVAGSTIELQGLGGCDSQTGKTDVILIKEPVISQFGITMSVDNAVVGENTQLIFATLELP